jgi:hypothetical protein
MNGGKWKEHARTTISQNVARVATPNQATCERRWRLVITDAYLLRRQAIVSRLVAKSCPPTRKKQQRLPHLCEKNVWSTCLPAVESFVRLGPNAKSRY